MNPANSIIPFTDTIWRNMTLSITGGRHVLIVGSEAVLQPEKSGTGDCQEYFELERKRRRAEDEEFSEKDRADQMLDIMACHEFMVEDINPDLLSILKTKCFRLVLTTNVDSYVEAAMRSVWGDELRVLDIYGDEAVDFDLEDETTSDEFYSIPPTLYYVFGKADPQNVNKKFAAKENDCMEAISRWIDNSTRPGKICSYLSHKEVLAVGCRFENWLFRFFWYTLRGNIQLPSSRGQVALTLPGLNIESYLKTEKIYTHTDAAAFLKELSAKLKDMEDSIGRLRALGGVFISYAGEDSAIATLLFDFLSSKGFNVWLDSRRLFGGAAYDERIKDAITSCKVFIPVLSPAVAEILDNGEETRYFLKEWKIAGGIPNLKVFPVATSGYNPRCDAHKKFEEKVRPVTIYELASQPMDNMTEQLKALL